MFKLNELISFVLLTINMSIGYRNQNNAYKFIDFSQTVVKNNEIAVISGETESHLKIRNINIYSRSLKYDYSLNGEKIEVESVGNKFKSSRIRVSYPQKLYLSITLQGIINPITIDNIILLPGDSIHLRIRAADDITFSGRGAERFHYFHKALNLTNQFMLKEIPPPYPPGYQKLTALQVSNYFDRIRLYYTIMKVRENLLDSIKSNLSTGEYNLIKSDLIYYYKYQATKILVTILHTFKPADFSSNDFNGLLRMYNSYVDSINLGDKYSENRYYLLSYRNYVLNKNILDRVWLHNEKSNNLFSVRKLYEKLKDKYYGIEREAIILEFLTNEFRRGSLDEINYYFNDAMKFFNNDNLKENLEDLLGSRTVGKKINQHYIIDTIGQRIQLNKFKGKIVIADFWFTGCIGCKGIAPILSRIEEKYKNRSDIIFINVSIDKNFKTFLHSARNNLYTSKGSLCFYTGGSGENHSIISDLKIGSYPTVVLIGRNGRICGNPINPLIDNGKNLEYMIELCSNMQ